MTKAKGKHRRSKKRKPKRKGWHTEKKMEIQYTEYPMPDQNIQP